MRSDSSPNSSDISKNQATAALAVKAVGPFAPAIMRTPVGGAILKVVVDNPGELSKDQITTLINGFRIAQPAMRTIFGGGVSNFDAVIPADIAVFDPETYAARATYEQPELTATGMRAVIVNGRIAVSDGAPSGEAAGKALLHTPPPGSCGT